MGKNLKNNKNSEFKHKNLLSFSGIATLTSMLFLALFGYTIGVLGHDAFGMYGGLIISVPFAVHLYCWGLFCEWKNIRTLPMLLKGLSIVWAIIVGISYILFLCGV